MRYIWIGFLLFLAFTAFMYIPFDYAQEQVVGEQSATLLVPDNITANNYMRMIWASVPIIFVMIGAFWVLSQGQKEGY